VATVRQGTITAWTAKIQLEAYPISQSWWYPELLKRGHGDPFASPKYTLQLLQHAYLLAISALFQPLHNCYTTATCYKGHFQGIRFPAGR
jgi:hypothetical protein